jgi:hypothetical protein
VFAVGVANAVTWLISGNAVDWLVGLVILVLVSGWYATPVLRWLSTWRR